MARDFNGSTDSLYYANVYDPSGSAFTWAGWVWVDSYAVDADNIWTTIYTGYWARAISIHEPGLATPGSNGELRVTISHNVGNTLYRHTNASTVSTGQWQHVVVTHDGTLNSSGLHIYVDGSEASYSASQDGTGTPNTADLEWFVGSGGPADLGLDGRLAELGWWNRVLDAGEIASLAAGFSPRCMPRGLKWAPDLVRSVTDPVTGQVGTLSGTSVLAHPPVLRPSFLPVNPQMLLTDTNETIGPSGREYTQPQAWFDANKNTPGSHIGVIDAGSYNELVGTGAVAGSTFTLQAANGDEFRGILDDDDPYAADTYAKFAGIHVTGDSFQFFHIGSNGIAAGGYGISPFEVIGESCLVDSCVIQDIAAEDIYGFYLTGASTVRDSVAARLSADGYTYGKCWGIYLACLTGAGRAYHNDIHLLSADGYNAQISGIRVGPNGIARHNGIGTLTGYSSVPSFELSGTGQSVDYNAVTEAAVGDAGPNSQTSLVPATEWVGAGSTGTDFHLADTNTKLRRNAGSLSGYPDAPTVDIDDQTIPTSGADIGIDTVLAEGPIAHHGQEGHAALAGTVAVSGSIAHHGGAALAQLRGNYHEGQIRAYGQEAHATLAGGPVVSGELAAHGEQAWAALAAVSNELAAHGQYAGAALAAGIVEAYFFDARGKYRVFNAAGYRFYRSTTGPPDPSDTPFATSATLPSTPTDTYADGPWYLSASYDNGVLDSGFLGLGPRGETYLRLDIAAGVSGDNPPPGPQTWQLQQVAAGVVRVVGFLVATGDNAPTEWAITYTTDGSAPATDTPTLTVAMNAGYFRILEYDLPAQADGTTVKVRLQTRYNNAGWVYSENSTVKTITADATGPAAPEHLGRWPGQPPAEY